MLATAEVVLGTNNQKGELQTRESWKSWWNRGTKFKLVPSRATYVAPFFGVENML